MSQELHPQVFERVSRLVRSAAEHGEREVTALRFPSEYCSHGGGVKEEAFMLRFDGSGGRSPPCRGCCRPRMHGREAVEIGRRIGYADGEIRPEGGAVLARIEHMLGLDTPAPGRAAGKGAACASAPPAAAE